MTIFGGWDVTAWYGGISPFLPATNIGVLTQYNPYLDPALLTYKTSGARIISRVLAGIKNPRLSLEWNPNDTSWLNEIQCGNEISSLHILLRKYIETNGAIDAIGLEYKNARAESIKVSLVAGGVLKCSADFIASSIGDASSQCPFGGIENETSLPWTTFDFLIDDVEETTWHEWGYNVKNYINRLPRLDTKATRLLLSLSRDVTGYLVRDSDGIADYNQMKEWRVFPSTFKVRINDNLNNVDLLGGETGIDSEWSLLEAPGTPSELFLRRFSFICSDLYPQGYRAKPTLHIRIRGDLDWNNCKPFYCEENQTMYAFYGFSPSIALYYAYKKIGGSSGTGLIFSRLPNNDISSYSFHGVENKILATVSIKDPPSGGPFTSWNHVFRGIPLTNGTLTFSEPELPIFMLFCTFSWTIPTYMKGASWGGARKWFALRPLDGILWGGDVVYTSINDGSSWDIGTGSSPLLANGLQVKILPLQDGDKCIEVYTKYDGHLYARYRADLDNPTIYETELLTNFKCPYHVGSLAEMVFDKTNGVVHLFAVNDLNQIVHLVCDIVYPTVWSNYGAVALNVTPYALKGTEGGISPSPAPVFDPLTGAIYLFFQRSSIIYWMRYLNGSWSDEAVFYEDIDWVWNISASPEVVGNKIVVCWNVYDPQAGLTGSNVVTLASMDV